MKHITAKELRWLWRETGHRRRFQEVCANCGATFGSHLRVECPSKKNSEFKFKRGRRPALSKVMR